MRSHTIAARGTMEPQTMRMVQYGWIAIVILFARPIALISRADERTAPTRINRVDESLTRAAQLLLRCQNTDGAWRSEIYGPLKDGPSLTPLAVAALLRTPASKERDVACRKGADYLAAMVKPDGTIEAGRFGIAYPVYTSAGAVVVLSQPGTERHRKARDAWLAYLRERQLTEERGWQKADKQYGGWGYCPLIPRKPRPGELAHPLTESNLSATVAALEALHAAGIKSAEPAFSKALVFVGRCQNFCDDPALRDATLDDGGFFFIYDDPARNKAGIVAKDRDGHDRFHSYGSMTADGLGALLACGRGLDDPRGQAARRWLEKHFRADIHPGKYAEGREARRSAVFYYYAASVARTLKAIGARELETEKGTVQWAEALADELLKRQQKDGSWVSDATEFREDDPLIATPLAITALAYCRAALTEKGR
jgi:Prenyltransferase and squalene oxidase repeat